MKNLWKATPAETWHGWLRETCVRMLLRRLWVKGGYPKFWTLASDSVSREILTHGLFEKNILLGLKTVLAGRGGVLLDVGANIGNHAVFLAPLFERVVAFEANPRMAKILEANIAVNGMENITVVGKGLGSAAGKLTFYENTSGNFGASSFVKSGGNGRKLTLEVVKGDDAVKAAGVKVKDITCLKLDVEGFERDVLEGLSKTVEAAQPLVLFEMVSLEDGAPVFEWLRARGYAHFYELDDGKARGWGARLRGGDGCWVREMTAPEDRYYVMIVASVEPLDMGMLK